MTSRLWWGFPALVLVFIGCQHDPVFPQKDLTEETGTDTPCDPTIIYFEKDVLPILVSSCAYPGCHDRNSRREGIELDNYDNTMRTGGVDPFNANKSKLYKVLSESGDDRMPPSPEAPLTQNQKDVIRDWINQGAGNYYCESCDTTVFTYQAAIAPIIENYCIRCHNDTRKDGDVSLASYDLVRQQADAGSLFWVLTASNGYPQMPQGGALPDCEITQVKKWIESGSSNN